MERGLEIRYDDLLESTPPKEQSRMSFVRLSRYPFHLAIPTLALAICLGCTKDTAPPKNTTTTTPGSAANQTPASTAATGDTASAVAVAGGGTLKGTIMFDGDEIPPQTMVPILTDPQICEKHGKGGYYPVEDYRDRPGNARHPLRHRVSQERRPSANGPTRRKQDLVLDNRNCRFEPHVAAARPWAARSK